MQTVALIFQNHTVYYSGLILALAALSAVFLSLALRMTQDRETGGLVWLLLLSALLSLPLSRLVHWYCNAEQYASFVKALTDYSSGGYSPLGVFAAVLLSAAVLRLCHALDDLPAVLDCLAPAGALGMAVGRMSCLFSSANRSKFTLADERFRRLPFMVSAPIASGGVEWRIATFALEAIAAAVICAALLLTFRRLRSRERFRSRWKDGNVFFLFLALYGAVNVVLDSTRYDALYLRSNGFVSVTQICCVAGLLFTTVLYSVRSVMTHGLRGWHFGIWLLWAGAAGLGGYMEYFVQRHADKFLTAYAVMESCFLLLFFLCCLLCSTTRTVPAAEVREAGPRPSRKKAADAEEAVPPEAKPNAKKRRGKPAPAPAAEEGEEAPAPAAETAVGTVREAPEKASLSSVRAEPQKVSAPTAGSAAKSAPVEKVPAPTPGEELQKAPAAAEPASGSGNVPEKASLVITPAPTAMDASKKAPAAEIPAATARPEPRKASVPAQDAAPVISATAERFEQDDESAVFDLDSILAEFQNDDSF